jgi:long-chain acyl-CoA synthetase
LPTGLLDKLVFNKIKSTLGGKVEQLVCAGAALDPATHGFVQVTLGIPIRNGYGLTEAGSGVICGPDNILMTTPGAVGGPLINVEVRIEPVDTFNDPSCGEILIGGPAVSSGYLNDEELTNNLFVDAERRWIRTGDVGRWVDGGLLQVVDRMRSIFKLSQGEYVAAETITQAYEECDFVGQIFVYGDSGKNCLVGIVIPKRSAVAKFYEKEELTDEEYRASCQDPKLIEECQQKMNETAKARGLFGFQWVKKIHLDWYEWTMENDLLTPTLKVRRKALGDKYQAEIQRMYKEYEAANR